MNWGAVGWSGPEPMPPPFPPQPLHACPVAPQVPKFTAAVIDFPQRGYGLERGIDIHGMVGMEFLEQFDIKYEKDLKTGVDMVDVYRAGEVPSSSNAHVLLSR